MVAQLQSILEGGSAASAAPTSAPQETAAPTSTTAPQGTPAPAQGILGTNVN